MRIVLPVALPALLAAVMGVGGAEMAAADDTKTAVIALPPPQLEGAVALERALHERRSQREYAPTGLTLSQLGQLLWSAQGVTGRDGARAAPSAGALYPLEVYLVAGMVRDLPAGLYHYRPARHELTRVAAGDCRAELAAAAPSQDWLRTAPAALVIAAGYERTARKYQERAPRYVHMEVGAVAQNVALQAVALGLGTTLVGAFDDAHVQRVLRLPAAQVPLAILPVGRRP